MHTEYQNQLKKAPILIRVWPTRKKLAVLSYNLVSKGKSLLRALLVSWGSSICTYTIQPDNSNPGKFFAERVMTVKTTEIIRNVGWITSSLISLYTVLDA